MKNKETAFLFIRYLILFLIALHGLFIIYFIFTPATIFPSFFVLKEIYGAVLNGNVISFAHGEIALVSACIAGSAYYLLLVLNLSTPMEIKKRVKSILFLLVSFLFINIIRIVVFSYLLYSGFEYFDIAHKAAWYFGSTVMVIILWFINIHIFNIKDIPIYTDFSGLIKETRKKY